MNVSAKASSSSPMLFINFNQDASCVSVGTKNGYKIYNCDPFGKCYAKSDGGIGIVEMLFCTSLVALVGAGEQPALSPRRLQITNTKRQSTICELTFPTSILAVKLNRKRLIVVLEEQIYVYDISNMKLLHTIETSPNPHAVCALSPSSENCYMAYPSPTPSPTSPFTGAGSTSNGGSSGDVLLFDALSLQVVNIVQAHKSAVSCLSMNSEGTMLATSSDKGTVIRVFSVPNAQKLFQFRRGSYPARIYSISFNMVSTLLCVSSDTETVHIFKLSGQGGDPNRDTTRRKSLGRNIAGSVGGYLPSSMKEMWEPSRDFAHLKLPGSGIQSVVALSNNTPQVMVVTSEGYFIQYSIDLESGGECVMLKQYQVGDDEES